MSKDKSTKDDLVIAGMKLASKIGVVNVTRRALAAAAKVSEALVSHHLGNREALQKTLKRQMKKHGLAEPTPEKIVAAGKRLRAKKTPAAPRKYSAREVEAMKRKGVPKKVGKGGTAASRKRAVAVQDKVFGEIKKVAAATRSFEHGFGNGKPAAKKAVAKKATAARAPKAPPAQSTLPLAPPLPPVPVPPLPPVPSPLGFAPTTPALPPIPSLEPKS